MSAQDLKQRARELLAAEYRIRKPYRTGPVLRGNLTRYEEAAIRAIVAALRQQPAPVDLGQFRKAVECWHDAALPANSVDAERKAEAKRLLSIIDNAILPSATNTIIGSVSPEMRPLAGGAVVKRANKAAAIATFVFFLTLAASYMCGVPIIERSPDNGLSYFLAVLFAVAAFAISATP